MKKIGSILNFIVPVVCVICFSCKTGNKDEDSSDEKQLISTNLSALNGDWELAEVNNEPFDISEIYMQDYGGKPYFTIDTDTGKISGFTGCNSWGGEFELQQGSIVLIGPLEMTQQGCAGNWESLFLSQFENNTSIKLNRSLLQLTSKDGQTMTFKRISR